MSIVVTLADYTPPARSDSISFDHVKIEEAAAAAGPWTLIDTQALSADPDPKHPAERDLTTKKATLAEGFYRVKWVSGTDETSPTEPVQNLSSLAGGLRPTLADVASKLRARTKIIGGTEAGTFTPSTRPTDDQVEDLIDDALDEVLGKIQTPGTGTEYERRARGAVALYTAILIETSYFPEQVGAGKSPATVFQGLYESRIKALIAEGETGEPQGEGTDESPADPYWLFPSGRGLASARW